MTYKINNKIFKNYSEYLNYRSSLGTANIVLQILKGLVKKQEQKENIRLGMICLYGE